MELLLPVSGEGGKDAVVPDLRAILQHESGEWGVGSGEWGWGWGVGSGEWGWGWGVGSGEWGVGSGGFLTARVSVKALTFESSHADSGSWATEIKLAWGVRDGGRE